MISLGGLWGRGSQFKMRHSTVQHSLRAWIETNKQTADILT